MYWCAVYIKYRVESITYLLGKYRLLGKVQEFSLITRISLNYSHQEFHSEMRNNSVKLITGAELSI